MHGSRPHRLRRTVPSVFEADRRCPRVPHATVLLPPRQPRPYPLHSQDLNEAKMLSFSTSPIALSPPLLLRSLCASPATAGIALPQPQSSSALDSSSSWCPIREGSQPHQRIPLPLHRVFPLCHNGRAGDSLHRPSPGPADITTETTSTRSSSLSPEPAT
jgi:hypothetical protein